MAVWDIVLKYIIPPLIASVLTAILTVRLSLRQFYSQKWWEKKAETYSAISADLSNLFFCIQELCSEAEGEKEFDKHTRDTLSNEFTRRFKSLKKTAASGAYIVSNEVFEVLVSLIKSLENNYYNQQKEPLSDFFGRDYKAIKSCKDNFNKLAKKDLNIN